MRMRIVAPVIAVLAVGGFAVYQWMELRAQRMRGADLAARVETLEAQPPAAPALLPDVPAAIPETAGDPAPPAQPVVPAPSRSQASASNEPAGPAQSPQSVLQALDSPEGREFASNMMRTMMRQMYPDIEAEVGLTPEEAQRLFDIMASGGQSSIGLLAGGPADPAARREMQRKIVEDARRQEQETQALLGSRYPKWEAYQSAATARQQVDQLRATLAASGNPLSEAQSKTLVSAFTKELMEIQRAQRDWMYSPEALESRNILQDSLNQAVEVPRKLAQAAIPHLTREQGEQFRRQVDQQETMLRATMGVLGAQGEAP